MEQAILEKYRDMWMNTKSKWNRGEPMSLNEIAFVELYEVVQRPEMLGAQNSYYRHSARAERLFEQNPNGEVEQAVVELMIVAGIAIEAVLEQLREEFDLIVDF